ncbi:WXG100 family type VII secretion target [Nocardia takedensis]|uniref:WXG100 family type VII secretion target n=1 Tax=Nocardia takedensis TaxID=259390 RepID=UPI0003043A3B|nr:WXG100 family type VII secretion target [Nocardia takedensis]
MTQGDGTFDIVPSEVADAGRYLQLTAQELIDGVRTLDTEISALLQGWTGVSATAYRSGWEETRQGAQAVLDALATLAELMGVTADTHLRLDSDRSGHTSSLDLP